MGRYLGPKCKKCRRADMKLFLKGPRCITEKCAFVKRPTPPGMPVRRRKKPTNYGLQLREKQKLKRMYGMLEKQFRRFFAVANRSSGVTGRVLIQLLERRLDNVIYRSSFVLSRNQARQVVRHGFVFVNGKRVDIPSYIVASEQDIEIRSTKVGLKATIKESIDINAKDRSIPTWIKVDKDNLKIKVVRLPEKEDCGIPVEEQLVVELYSK